MELLAVGVKNGILRSSTRRTFGADRENEQPIVHPGYAMLFRVDPIDHGQEVVLVTEFSFEVHDHGRGCAIDISRPVEKRTPKRTNEYVVPGGTQLRGEVRARIVQQRYEPTDHL